jgi:hypothetical protein
MEIILRNLSAHFHLQCVASVPYGNDVFELEAIPPAQLQAILRESIDSVLDTAAFNGEVEAEKHDAAKLDGIRKTLQGSLGSVLADTGGPSVT